MLIGKVGLPNLLKVLEGRLTIFSGRNQSLKEMVIPVEIVALKIMSMLIILNHLLNTPN